MKKMLLLLGVTLGVWAPLFAQTEIWESFPEIANCHDITVGPDSAVWMATRQGAYKYHKGTLTFYSTENVSVFTTNSFQSVLVDADGYVWLGTYGGNAGAFKFDGTDWVQYNTSNSGLANNLVMKIGQDAVGDIWFATWGGGVSRLSTTGTWTTFNVENTDELLAYNSLFTAAIGPDDSKWFGTNGHGLSKFNGSIWEHFDTGGQWDSGQYITGIAFDKQGNPWVGTFGGVGQRATNGDWTNYRSENSGLKNNIVSSLFIDWKDNKWIGYYGNIGVSKLQGTTWMHYDSTNNDILKNRILVITADPYGRKWFGTTNGVAVLTDEDALPLQLVSFDGTTENDLVTLFWATTQEENVYGFEIERSKDGRDFTKLGFVEARNSNSSTQRYRYVDASAPGGKIYYRLRMKDLDGSFTLSPIVVVESTGPQNRISVYPNPVKDRLFIEDINHEPLTTRLFDQNGRVRAATHGNSLDMTPYAAGIYFLKTTDAQGVLESRKVIVEK